MFDETRALWCLNYIWYSYPLQICHLCQIVPGFLWFNSCRIWVCTDIYGLNMQIRSSRVRYSEIQCLISTRYSFVAQKPRLINITIHHHNGKSQEWLPEINRQNGNIWNSIGMQSRDKGPYRSRWSFIMAMSERTDDNNNIFLCPSIIWDTLSRR